MAKAAPHDDDLISISELATIVNRKLNTIRKWERSGLLPKRLHSRRGPRGWRYWTREQVYGHNGIIEWMHKRDMRPGNLMAAPENEAVHVEHLRRPKYLNGHHIRSARQMSENGRSPEYIVRKILPRTRYAGAPNLEAALRRIAEIQGWEFAPGKKQQEEQK